MRYFVIAEIGIAHEGDMEVARNMIEASSNAGADFVKFQYYDAAEIKDEFKDKALFDRVKQSQLSIRQLSRLKKAAGKYGIGFVCTPFKTRRRLAELARLKPDAIKIRYADGPSGAGNTMVDYGLSLRSVQRLLVSCRGVPLDSVTRMWSSRVRWLFCIPKYPPSLEDYPANLATGFHGFSDHFPHISASILGAALARPPSAPPDPPHYIIEKHVAFDDQQDVPDRAVSISFTTLATLVGFLRDFERLRPEDKMWFPDLKRGLPHPMKPGRGD